MDPYGSQVFKLNNNLAVFFFTDMSNLFCFYKYLFIRESKRLEQVLEGKTQQNRQNNTRLKAENRVKFLHVYHEQVITIFNSCNLR